MREGFREVGSRGWDLSETYHKDILNIISSLGVRYNKLSIIC